MKDHLDSPAHLMSALGSILPAGTSIVHGPGLGLPGLLHAGNGKNRRKGDLHGLVLLRRLDVGPLVR